VLWTLDFPQLNGPHHNIPEVACFVPTSMHNSVRLENIQEQIPLGIKWTMIQSKTLRWISNTQCKYFLTKRTNISRKEKAINWKLVLITNGTSQTSRHERGIDNEQQ